MCFIRSSRAGFLWSPTSYKYIPSSIRTIFKDHSTHATGVKKTTTTKTKLITRKTLIRAGRNALLERHLRQIALSSKIPNRQPLEKLLSNPGTSLRPVSSLPPSLHHNHPSRRALKLLTRTRVSAGRRHITEYNLPSGVRCAEKRKI